MRIQASNEGSLSTHRICFLLLTSALLAVHGCGKSPPPITAVQGTLLLNNQPLPFAYLEFYPELDKFGSELNSSAVTDAKGNFTLTCHANGQPGAVVASHRIVVVEGPPPAGMRGMDGESQTRLGEYMSKLTNRPIPDKYGNYSQTPLRVDITSTQKDYVLHMAR